MNNLILIILLTVIVDANKVNYMTHFKSAVDSMTSGDPVVAEKKYKEATKLYQKDSSRNTKDGVKIYNAKGWNQILQSKFTSKTIKNFDDALKEDTNISLHFKSEINSNKGYVYWMKGDINKSEESFNKSLLLNNENRNSIEYLTKIYIKRFKLALEKDSFKTKLIDKLTSNQNTSNWSKQKDYLNIGMAQKVWCPKDPTNKQDFDKLVQSLKMINPDIVPAFLEEGCPWNNKDEFYADKVKRYKLDKFLKDTQTQQLEIFVRDFINTFPMIVRDYDTLQKVKALFFNKNSLSAHGIMCLMDYFAFKGKGTTTNIRTCNDNRTIIQRAGLLDVLKDINGTEDIYNSFYTSSKKLLMKRVEVNCSGDAKHKTDWLNHIEKYKQ